MQKLTTDKIAKLTKPGIYSDRGNGLYLRVARGGSKSWVLRYRLKGVRKEKGLGGFPATTLTAARKMAVEYRAEITAGRNPFAAKEAANAAIKTADSPATQRMITFREAALQVHRRDAPGWTSERGATNWLRSLEIHFFPYFGDRPVNMIDRHDVLDVLDRIWTTKPNQARLVRSRIRKVFAWAQVHGYIPDEFTNPAGEVIDEGLKSPRKPVQHRPALPYDQVPEFMELLRQRLHDPNKQLTRAGTATLFAFRFLILTVARTREVLEADWSEIDFNKGLWTIPASKMKMRREHRVPLSQQAMKLLHDAAVALGKGQGIGLVFPGDQSRLGARQIAKVCAREIPKVYAKEAAEQVRPVPHGFRSSFRDWAAEEPSRFSYEAIELSLAHSVGSDTERRYFRTNLLEQRRALMQRWADFIAPQNAMALPLPAWREEVAAAAVQIIDGPGGVHVFRKPGPDNPLRAARADEVMENRREEAEWAWAEALVASGQDDEDDVYLGRYRLYVGQPVEEAEEV